MQYCSSIHNRSPGGTPHQTAGSRSGGRALRNIPARNAAKRTQIWVRPASRSGRGSILPPGADLWRAAPTAAPHSYAPEIGRASSRERVCQYVYISVVAVSLQKKNVNYKTHQTHFVEGTTQSTKVINICLN